MRLQGNKTHFYQLQCSQQQQMNFSQKYQINKKIVFPIVEVEEFKYLKRVYFVCVCVCVSFNSFVSIFK